MATPSAQSASPAPLPARALEDWRATVIGIVAFCLAWATVMVCARLWTRGVIIKKLGVDDYMCVVGLLATYGSGIAIAHMTRYGLGRHVEVMELANIPLYLRVNFYVPIVMCCSALLFLKMTFLCQYYRVLAVQHMRRVYIGSMVIVGGWALSQVLVGIFICQPVLGFWDKSVPSKCIPNIPQWHINAAGNIATDIAVFALPLPALWRLRIARPAKAALLAVFSLGFFTVVISIVRIRYLRLFEDFPWENVASSLWSVGELTSALTCACLPTLRPLVVRFFPVAFASQPSGPGRSISRQYAPAHHSGARTGPLSLESGLGRGAGHGGNGRPKASHDGDGSSSLTGSEVELAQTTSKSNAFEVRVMRQLTVDVERESPWGAGRDYRVAIAGIRK
ncbi:hypothetical protein P885DRAFT_43209 [Corynascus similis CBS 632.67]